jgi:hypothetical protein
MFPDELVNLTEPASLNVEEEVEAKVPVRMIP